MRSILILATAMITCGYANAQKVKEADVPAEVKSAFSKKFPGVKVEKWEKESEGYEAEFDLNKVETSAVFDEKGNYKEMEQEIKVSALPKAVTDYCAKNYAGYKIEEAAKITDASGKIMYEAELEKGKEEFDVIFDENGNFIKKAEQSQGDEDDD